MPSVDTTRIPPLCSTFRFPLCLGILSLFFSASTLAQSAAVSRSVVGDDVPSYDSSQVVAVASSSAPSASGSPPSPSGMAGPFNSTDPRGGRGPGGGSNGTDSPSIGDAAFAGVRNARCNSLAMVRGGGHRTDEPPCVMIAERHLVCSRRRPRWPWTWPWPRRQRQRHDGQRIPSTSPFRQFRQCQLGRRCICHAH